HHTGRGIPPDYRSARLSAFHGRDRWPGRQGSNTRGSHKVICRYFRVSRSDMVYLKFIMEAYEGMNVMTTVDNTAGIIRIVIMPGFEEEMDALLAELGKKVVM